MNKATQKIVARFKFFGVRLPATDYVIKRTKAGRHQKSAGAWTWFLWSPNDPNAGNCGSVYRASDIARNPQAFELYRDWRCPSQCELLPGPRISNAGRGKC